MTILVTGANGRTSRHLISVLLSSPACPALRLLVHSQSSQEHLATTFPKLLSTPHDIVIADYLKPNTLAATFKGVSTVFYNGPAHRQWEAAMGIAVIDAAKESGEYPHFIFCSILHPMRTKLVDHKAKLTIEEYLTESKLNYTILQPTHYMQNIPLASICESGVLRLGYPPSVVHGFVDIKDVAEVARDIISSPATHNFASYELVGQNLSYSAIADIIGSQLGKAVRCEVLPTKVFARENLSPGEVSTEHSQDASERRVLYYARWGLTGNSNVLRWLLGREPKTWDEYAAETLRQVEKLPM